MVSFALDLVQTAGSVAGALSSLPGKAVDRFLRHTGLTDKYNARAAGHMVTDALGLAGAAAAAKGLAKAAVRGARPAAAGARKAVRFADGVADARAAPASTPHTGTVPAAMEPYRITDATAHPSLPVGSRHNPMPSIFEKQKAVHNSSTIIEGRLYTDHALDRMMGRGIRPSAKLIFRGETYV